jgi:hypothetical protein
MRAWRIASAAAIVVPLLGLGGLFLFASHVISTEPQRRLTCVPPTLGEELAVAVARWWGESWYVVAPAVVVGACALAATFGHLAADSADARKRRGQPRG